MDKYWNAQARTNIFLFNETMNGINGFIPKFKLLCYLFAYINTWFYKSVV